MFLSMSMCITLLAAPLTACMADSTEYGNAYDYLKPARREVDADDADDTNAPPAKTTKATPSSSASTQAPAKTTTPPATSASTTTASKPPSATCEPSQATTKADCQKCCAAKNYPPASAPAPKAASSCACGGKCGALCGDNLCDGDAPSIACGVCLLVAKCDPSETGASAPPAPSPAEACQKVCNAKP